MKDPSADCLSCKYATVLVKRELKIICAYDHKSGHNCPDYKDSGTRRLLNAIAQSIKKNQLDYRVEFKNVSPDCVNCTQNCCNTPFLTKTPFYPEDAIYYLLMGKSPPKIDRKLARCQFFNLGCTLEPHLRPHACVEHPCKDYPDYLPMNIIARRLNRNIYYLLAVATQDWEWRGELPEDGAAVAVDRFGRKWNLNSPIADLLELYQVETDRKAEQK